MLPQFAPPRLLRHQYPPPPHTVFWAINMNCPYPLHQYIYRGLAYLEVNTSQYTMRRGNCRSSTYATTSRRTFVNKNQMTTFAAGCGRCAFFRQITFFFGKCKIVSVIVAWSRIFIFSRRSAWKSNFIVRDVKWQNYLRNWNHHTFHSLPKLLKYLSSTTTSQIWQKIPLFCCCLKIEIVSLLFVGIYSHLENWIFKGFGHRCSSSSKCIVFKYVHWALKSKRKKTVFKF